MLPPVEADPHGSLRLSSGVYRAALEAIGFRTVIVDLERFGPAELRALRDTRLQALFSDGGWVNSVMIEDRDGEKPLPERLGVPVVALINDNPCSDWMPLIMGRDDPRQTTAFLDADFATLWRRWVPQRGSHRVYVPACPPMPPPPPEAERDIPVLTVATLRPSDQFRRHLEERCPEPLVHALYSIIVDTGLAETLAPFSAVCDTAFAALGIRLNLETPGHRFLLCLADHHIRNERRRRMIARLAHHPITLVGHADDVPLHPDSRVLPPVPHSGLMALYRRARVVVACPPYVGGVSERLTHPMAAGAVVVAPPTILSDRLLGRDRVFATVAGDFGDLADGLARATDPGIRRRILATAQAEVVERFTPEAMMRDLMSGVGALPASAPAA
ncbi:glycosyltransferase [Azospirillum griseum]|uniref:Glycosyltransferase family 1 protein n=1 Tax=Azospirillum griseum TaxID=2496639 RepID=A0A431VBZ1_9PROT|nr:glycosyltransferase [Azospirillum griseum]RTR16287.1 glycosyltransferase family 1 protein [Azospirillum griseum]